MTRRQTCCAVGLLLFLAAAGGAEDRNLLILAKDMGATLEWDALRDTGVLSVGDDRIAIGVGVDSALINYRLKVSIDAPVRRDGAVWLTRTAIDAIGKGVRDDRLAHAGERMRVSSFLIDPGHGGEDPGASGSFKDGSRIVTLREKDVTLAIALKLGEMLRSAYPDRTVVYTRTTDATVSLEKRPEIANAILDKTADTVLYVSLHINSSPLEKTSTRGFQVWYLPPTYSRPVLNKDSVAPEDQDILPIMNSMREEEITLETVLLAQEIRAGLAQSVGDRTEDRGLFQNDWAVVRNARMPAVLLELGFINNPEEAKRLADPAYLKDVARGIYSGISGFISRFERNQE